MPVGTPGRAQFGAKLLTATFGVSAITQPAAAGDFTWTSLFTPYNPGNGTVNAAGSVETQAIKHIPTQVKLTYTKKKVTTFKKVKGKRVKSVSTKVSFSSSATESGKPATGTITTTAAGKKVGGAKGSFTFKGKSVTLTATADLHKGAAVPTGAAPTDTDLFYTDLGAAACTKSAIFGGLPCVAATVARSTPKASTRVVGYTKYGTFPILAGAMPAPVRIGTCSWADDALAKHWYPEGTPPRERLAYYAERFSTVEVDSTYYRVPTRADGAGLGRPDARRAS